MKKFLSLALAFTISSLGLVSLLAQPVRAQQVASVGKSINEMKEEYERFLAVERDPSTPAEVKEVNHQLLETRRTQLRAAIESRLGALRKYQTSMSSMLSAEESLVVGNSIQALEKDLSALTGETKAPAAATPRARIVADSIPATLREPVDASPVSPAPRLSSGAAVTGNLSTTETAGAAVVRAITLNVASTCKDGIVTIALSNNSAATTPLTITVTDAAGNIVDTRTVALGFNVFSYTSGVSLAVGNNTIKVTDASGNESATANLTGVSCAPPAPAVLEEKPRGHMVGLLLGGAVSSQQGENFSQADPFLGFIAGYDHVPDFEIDTRDHIEKPLGGALHWRVQGIFQVQPKKEEAPVANASATPAASPTPTPTPSASPTPLTGFQPFLASRKTFDIEMQLWYDWAAKNWIFFGHKDSRNPDVRVGLYGNIGASSYLDKNELKGDEKVKVKDPATGGLTELDTSNAKIDNDLNKYWEFGLIGNFFTFKKQKNKDGTDSEARDFRQPRLFMRASVGYGYYESLEGFNPGKTGFLNNSRNRFIGKLRIFPKFLDSDPEGGADSSPMFGVEINAGRGPDQIKFFTGMATAFKLFGGGGKK